MKTHPILFSTEMVQAIIQGNKTQTRRVVKPQPPEQFSNFGNAIAFVTDKTLNHSVYCPYGQVGDVLWVRESFCFTGSLEYLHPETKMPFMYKADIKDVVTAREVMKDHGWKFKPSIHMPREACRLFLEITAIRVERLQDISNEDAIAEGVRSRLPDCGIAYSEFETLWKIINGDQSWYSNPWVWVIEFKRIEKPEYF